MSAFSQYVSALLLADEASDIWTRPAEWLTLPTLADTDDRTVILYRVEDGGYNTVALNAQGNYTVDWGDGSTPENFASGVQAEHTYTYDDADLLASEMSDGAQQAIISITPQATYSITKLQLHVRPAAAPYGYYASGIMDVSVSAPSMTVFRFGRTDAGTSILLVDFPHLRQCSLYMPAITDMTYMMRRLVSLREIPRWVVGTGLTNASFMLYGCASLQSLPAGMTLAACTTTTSAFSGCTSLQAADGLAIPQSFSIASCNFGAAALDALYTALPTVTGKTITVTGNPGTSGDDPSIATAKGWTVAGS